MDLVRLPHGVPWRKPVLPSGGQKQRVDLVRAAEPDLILCDEVTPAPDTLVAAAILDLITELRREPGLSVLFISHDLHAVRSVCNEIIVVKNSRRETRAARNDFHKPSSCLYYERLKRAVPELRQGWLDEHQESDIAL